MAESATPMDIVAALAECATPPALFNQYSFAVSASESSASESSASESANGIRRVNLRRYLSQMMTFGPTTLLVGEAAGYRGCRLTGIPFTSESQLVQGVPLPGCFPSMGLFGVQRGYRPSGEWPRLSREQSATIVWQTLAEAPSLPLLWNALPFHPHPPDRPWANRTPRPSELAVGIPFLVELLALFPIRTICTVGRRANETLARMKLSGLLPDKYTVQQVRHPAHGGKRAFRAGVLAVLAGGSPAN